MFDEFTNYASEHLIHAGIKLPDRQHTDDILCSGLYDQSTGVAEVARGKSLIVVPLIDLCNATDTEVCHRTNGLAIRFN